MALTNFKFGRFGFGREAARAYGVPPSTFKDRLNGKEPRRIKHQHKQRLTLPEKTSLLIRYLNRTCKDLLPYIRGHEK